jgi:hypothetical protein
MSPSGALDLAIYPYERVAVNYPQAIPTGVLSDTLRAENPDLGIPPGEALPEPGQSQRLYFG